MSCSGAAGIAKRVCAFLIMCFLVSTASGILQPATLGGEALVVGSAPPSGPAPLESIRPSPSESPPAASVAPASSSTPTVLPDSSPPDSGPSEATMPPTPTRLAASPSPAPTFTRTATPIHSPSDRDPTRITIASIDVDARIVTVDIVEKRSENGETTQEWEVADYAAGFHRGMARVGHAGNTVISGHNNMRGKVFRDVHRLEPGDDIVIWVGTAAYRYRVRELHKLPMKGVPPDSERDNQKWILPTRDQRLTLVTCWPAWSNTHRIVVVAYPVASDS